VSHCGLTVTSVHIILVNGIGRGYFLLVIYGRLLSMEEMKSSFGIKITFIDHYKITKAIPNIWLENIEYKATCPYSVRRPLALTYLLKNIKKGCSELCKILNHNNDVIPIKAETKCISDLSLEGSLCN
jgi:hypothetical protein